MWIAFSNVILKPFNFFLVVGLFKVVLINIVAILMMSTKLATLDLLKIKIF